MNKNFTAMIYTFNEERRLPYVYENLKNFCGIIVFDGGSTDGTFDYCKKHNIEFVSRPKEDKNSEIMDLSRFSCALKYTPTEYVMHVYCSHFYPEALLNYFSKVADENELSAVYHDVIVYRYGVIVHKPFVRRIASAWVFHKKSIITYEGSVIHDELAIKFDKTSMVRLKATDDLSMHLFLDDDCSSLTTKTVKYTDLEAKQKFMAGVKIGFWGLLFKPLWRFVFAYFRLGSIIRGESGLVYSILNLVYDFQVSIKLWELRNGLDRQGVFRENHLVRTKLNKDVNDSLRV